MTASPFDAIRFRYPWRDYQARVLEELRGHLDDRKLHVVAAPGAGKTVLGLEVMRAVGLPTLILAPSIAIRNQWTDRLAELFLDGEHPDWVSHDLEAPGLVTVATYQALHVTARPEVLKEAGIRVVILDEAHHLRQAWWSSLQQVVDALEPKTVSLTATPPYDVASIEWARYNALCGPIDAEISIPELVKSGDLAPHQDLVHISTLDTAEEYRALVARDVDLRRSLCALPDMVAHLKAHPWIVETGRNISLILDQPELFTAMLIYLADTGEDVSPYARRVLGVGGAALPKISDPWLITLFDGLRKELPESVLAMLRKSRVLSGERVRMPAGTREDQEKLLRDARGKLDAIVEIAAAEDAAMGDTLRLAILTDQIGRYSQAMVPDKTTAAAVFERLRSEGCGGDLCVLTGSLVIAPKGALAGDGIAARPLPGDDRYEQITLTGAASDRRVQLVTDLFTRGTVRVLIGTRALLGQGWDAPAMNTLILASSVKSFVSSNQMRGRAIRRDPADPGKAAHIWHIATAAPDAPGPEVQTLAHRFDAFTYLNPETGRIASGFPVGDAETVTARSRDWMAAREELAARWDAALIAGGPNPHIRHRIETPDTRNRMVQRVNTISILPNLAGAGAAAGIWAVAFGTLGAGLVLAGGAALALWPAVRRIRHVIRHGTRAGSLRETARALLYGMTEAGLIRTPRERLDVQTGETADGLVYCMLQGATLPEETRFLAALEEIFAPIDNPRYLIVRDSYLGRRLQSSPFPVPRGLGDRKERAEAFLDGWHRHVGPGKLVYTRTVQGRLKLLQARVITAFEPGEIKRSSIWE